VQLNQLGKPLPRSGHYDGVLLVSVVLLCIFGVIMVYSSSAILARAANESDTVYLRAQVGKLIFGLGLLLVFMRLPYRVLAGRFAVWAVLGSILLLGLLLLPLGLAVVVRGTRRFLNLGLFVVQPAEFARISLVVFLSAWGARVGEERMRGDRRTLVVPLVAIGLVAGLIVLQPNLSSAVLVGMLGFVLLWSAGQPWQRLAVVLVPLVGVVAVSLRGYQLRRIVGFLEGLTGGGGSGLSYHLKQSLIAAGSGGLLGKGIGQGLQKYHYLPFPHTDSILGVVAEETGFLGVLVLFVVYGIVFLRGLRIARHAPDRFSGLLALGLTLSVAVNVFLHSAVVLGVGPATGVPLPFISHGGSSLLVHLTAMGMLLSISRHVRPETEAVQRTWVPGALSRVS
jgi:cell division protein FtsW